MRNIIVAHKPDCLKRKEMRKNKEFDLSQYEAIFFDEICKHSPERLKRIAYFIINNPKLLVFGGGDVKQLAPINYEGNTKYLDDYIYDKHLKSFYNISIITQMLGS